MVAFALLCFAILGLFHSDLAIILPAELSSRFAAFNAPL